MGSALLFLDLREVLSKRGCPVCRVLVEADRHYIRIFLREGKFDGRVYVQLIHANGLCRRHAWLLVEIEPRERGDGLGTATVYDALLDRVLLRLGDARDRIREIWEPRKRRRRRRTPGSLGPHTAARLAPTAACVACEALRQYEEVVVFGLLDSLGPGEDRYRLTDRFERADGLCLPHFRQALGLAEEPKAAARLVEVQRRAWARLRDEAEGFLRGHRAAATGGIVPEPEEGPIWRRLAETFAGFEALDGAWANRPRGTAPVAGAAGTGR